MRALAEQPPPPPTLTSVESDDDRIRAFVDGEYRQVVATVALVCGSVATAEDSVQEALARAWEQTARGKEIERLPAWITTVALNLARSQMRRWRSERRARTRLGALRPEIHDVTGASGEAYAIRQALLALPRRQREVTALRYYLGLDVRAIAEQLGIAEGTVKAMLYRAPVARGGARRHARRRAGAQPCRFVRSSSSSHCTRRRRVSAPSECSTASPTSARRRTVRRVEFGSLTFLLVGACRRLSCSRATTIRTRAWPHGRARDHRWSCDHARPGNARARRYRSSSTPTRATCADRSSCPAPRCRSRPTTTTATVSRIRRRASFGSTTARSTRTADRSQGRDPLDRRRRRRAVGRDPQPAPPNGLPDAFLKRIGADGAVISTLLASRYRPGWRRRHGWRRDLGAGA